jgi:DNA-3-methyladenine glycosylase II
MSMTFNGSVPLPVRRPFRLDLTVEALRRLAANVVDVVDADGTFYRALDDAEGTTLIAVRQHDADAIEVRTTGVRGERWLPTLARMLGVDADLSVWRQRSAKVPWLHRLAIAFDGLKPPRYATVWEACAHAIVFQQISIHAAAAIMRRCVELLGEPVVTPQVRCVVFPAPGRWLAADEGALRQAGLSRNKVAHLRSVAGAFGDGTLDQSELERLSTAQAVERLCAVRGIGPWSAAVVMLRGLGRLEVFPLRDSGVARSVALLAGEAVDLDAVLETLGPSRGMLYYHLLLGRLHSATPGPTGRSNSP